MAILSHSYPVCLSRYFTATSLLYFEFNMPNCRTGVVFALISCCAEGSDASLTSSNWADPAPASNYDAEGMLHRQGKRHAAVSVMAAAVPAFLRFR